MRRLSLPAIIENRKVESKIDSEDWMAERSKIKASLKILKSRSQSLS